MRRKCLVRMLGLLLLSATAVDAFEPTVQDAAKSSPLGGTSIFGEAPLPTADGGSLRVPKLTTPTTNLKDVGTGTLPKNDAQTAMSALTPLPEGGDRPEGWVPSQYAWQASNAFYHPLYFEDIMLERHGHERCPELTPLFAGARFFATFPALPYLMTLKPPSSTEYSLGHWRPGSPAPRLFQRPPWQRDAAIVEGAVVTGAVLVFP